MIDYATVLRSPPFKFIIGDDAQCFTVPRAFAKGVSEPLDSMMNNENLKEALTGQATIEDCEGEVFAAFCQFCFTGEYQVPKVALDIFDEQEQFSIAKSPPPAEEVSKPDEQAIEPADDDLAPADDDLAPADYDLAPADYDWGFGKGKKGKSKKGMKKSVLSELEEEPVYNAYCASCGGGVVDPPAKTIPSPGEQLYKKHRSYYDELWTTFNNLSIKRLSPIPIDPNLEKDNFISIEADPLRFHCKVYVLAEKYLAFSLAKLALQNLHTALLALPRGQGSVRDIVEVLRYCFGGGDSRITSRDSALRKVVVAFAAARAPELKVREDFRELLDMAPELSSDFVMALG